jgi:hypothetical protein
MAEIVKWSIAVQVSLDKKPVPLSKIIRAKSAGGKAQTVQHLPSKHKALSSNPSTNKPFKKCLPNHHISITILSE